MESEFINWLRQRLSGHPQLRLGLGDDAAILDLSGGACVVTSDMLTDGVDFQLDRCDPRRVGRKALAVNLSDLAAMAVRPLAATVSLALPRRGAKQLAIELYEGLIPLAEQFQVAIAGGDTNSWDGGLVISVTALGELTDRPPLVRGGAVPGDDILVTGTFGGSILGKHFDFQPRVREALLLNAHYQLHAAIDVSDGLSLDLARMAEESGCGAVLDLDQIPLSDDAWRIAQLSADGASPLDHALADGEDFELVLAAPSEEARRLLNDQPLETRITRIGYFVGPRGLWRLTPDGSLQPLPPRGYEHRLEG